MWQTEINSLITLKLNSTFLLVIYNSSVFATIAQTEAIGKCH